MSPKIALHRTKTACRLASLAAVLLSCSEGASTQSPVDGGTDAASTADGADSSAVGDATTENARATDGAATDGGMSCSTSSDCAPGQRCGFTLAMGCTARGVCIQPDDGGASCFDPGGRCGCDGRPVDIFCGKGSAGEYTSTPAGFVGPCPIPCGPGTSCPGALTCVGNFCWLPDGGSIVDAAGEGGTDASACISIDQACAKDAGSEYQCVRDWQTAQKAATWCPGSLGVLGPNVGVYSRCDGFDIVAVGAADTSVFYYYSPATNALVGIEAHSLGGTRCLGGVSPAVPLTDCFEGSPPVSLCARDASAGD